MHRPLYRVIVLRIAGAGRRVSDHARLCERGK